MKFFTLSVLLGAAVYSAAFAGTSYETFSSVRPQFQTGDYVVSGFDLPVGFIGIRAASETGRNQTLMTTSIGTLENNTNTDPRISFGIREASLANNYLLSRRSKLSLRGGIIPLGHLPWHYYESATYPFVTLPRIYEERLVLTRDIGVTAGYEYSKFAFTTSFLNGQGTTNRNVDNNLTIIGATTFRSPHSTASLYAGTGETGVFYASQRTAFGGADFVRMRGDWYLEANVVVKKISGFQPTDYVGSGAGFLYSIDEDRLGVGLRASYVSSYSARPATYSYTAATRTKLGALFWNLNFESYWNTAGKNTAYRYLLSTQWDFTSKL